MTNSTKLARLSHRPSRVKMTTGDFIEDSLYHPKYGYFSQQVEIFQPENHLIIIILKILTNLWIPGINHMKDTT